MPGNVEEQGDKNNEASSALSLGGLRNSLMPENALSARFNTTAGPDLKQISGTVYAGAHPGEEQRILWFRFEERLIPTGKPYNTRLEIRANNVMRSLHVVAASTTRTSPLHSRNRLAKATQWCTSYDARLGSWTSVPAQSSKGLHCRHRQPR